MRKEYQSKAAKYTRIFRNTVLQGLIVRYLIVLCFIVMCTWSFYGMRTIEAINYNIIKLLISDDTSLPVFVMESFVEGKSWIKAVAQGSSSELHVTNIFIVRLIFEVFCWIHFMLIKEKTITYCLPSLL